MGLVLKSRVGESRFEVDALLYIIVVAFELLPTFMTESVTVPSEIVSNVLFSCTIFCL